MDIGRTDQDGWAESSAVEDINVNVKIGLTKAARLENLKRGKTKPDLKVAE
jgi:hypothetical protein